MSEKDRFDWNDDMEFDAETDGQEDFGSFDDPLGFDDFEDLSDYEDLPESDSPAADAMAIRDRMDSDTAPTASENLAEKLPADAVVAVRMKKKKRRKGISAIGMGFLFSASILVAGIGVGGAILLAEGVHPSSLWKPQNFLQVDQLLNFADHPLNILYMVALGITFLALLGSYKMAKAATLANDRTRDAETMLDRLTSLSLEKQEDWESQEFKEFPPAEAFVIRVLGAWRLQEARQKRLMGVEGELHRLEKALSTNSRSDLTGRFDSPAVGRLADEMLRYFDARDTAVGNLQEFESRDIENSKEIVSLLQHSRKWNGATLDTLSVQCATLDKLTGDMKELAAHAEKAMAERTTTEGLTDIVEGIRKDLDKHAAKGSSDGMGTELNELVDRGSKLAFQIAMEVARLGPRGERLLPMSQSLEDLTTGFRKLADRANDPIGGADGTPGLKIVHKKLETLAALITEDAQGPWRDITDEVQDFGPATGAISRAMTRLTEGFNQQEDRLVQAGTHLSDMTGAEFDSSSIPRKESSEAPVPSLDVTREAPIKSGSEPKDLDPFAASGASILAGGQVESDPEFSSSVIPGTDSISSSAGRETRVTSLDLEGANSFSLGQDPAPDMPLSDDEEKVYDLEDFGAASVEDPALEGDQVFDISDFGGVPMDQESPDSTDEVYELSDFGAEPMAGAMQKPEGEEEVYDLSDFGASPMDETGSDTGEEIHDLTEFDATPLDQAVGSDLETPGEDEEVYDLSDFGGQPIK